MRNVCAVIGALCVIAGTFMGCVAGPSEEKDYSIEVNKPFKHEVVLPGMVVSLRNVSEVHGQYKGEVPKVKGSFFIASVYVKSVSTQTRKFDGDDLSLFNKNGDEVHPTNLSKKDATLKTGELMSLDIVYELPINSKPAYLSIQDKVLDIPVR